MFLNSAFEHEVVNDHKPDERVRGSAVQTTMASLERHHSDTVTGTDEEEIHLRSSDDESVSNIEKGEQ